ncbi:MULTISPECIES: carbamate kinase [Clostridia]|uniref:carbamate kinase n=1 Tax=Clostridia TaxID=186801 RepID=UPI000EA242EC|nr:MULTISPECIES: carbamate kinase [Clostridia]NBJ71060.1 carbamate kinase [Roseburia sp. 1XD42-34]RKI75342.1 carbamate kinase [Clostridium sp. 1xD42-85]
MGKVLIALGGNALGNNPKEQLELVRESAKPIADMIEQGHHVIIAHGNGPQVGAIHIAFDYASKKNTNIPKMPFAECGAMSQGYIGYHLQNAIREELFNRSIHKSVSTIISQVVVDKDDPAFKNPTKPIGSFLSKHEAEKLMKETNDVYVEDAGRGYRKVIPSPLPIKVVEKEVIANLVDAGHIVITIGGGGIPVMEKEASALEGVDAVIDKDLASQCLANELDVDFLFILTAVEKIAIHYGKPNQQDLEQMTITEAKKYIAEGQFAPGSMLPKVQAAIQFVQGRSGRKAIITSLNKAKEAILGKTGTTIYS